MDINKVAVIGAGIMGSGIAAHIANAGVPVLLLDIVPPGADNRSVLAEGALSRMLKSNPAPFMSKEAVRRVTVGNIEDDLGSLAEVDWIVEAVLEDVDIKRNLYSLIERVRKPGTIVSSNTSTIPLSSLVEDRSESFRTAFMLTHFFNPARYMRLLEIVRGPETRDETVETIRNFADVRLGKGVVMCKDRPGFVANRIGIYWIQAAVREAFDLGISVDEADALIGCPLGIPKTGVFGLLDLVGIDLMPKATASMLARLPEGDPFRAIARAEPLIERMISNGYTGRKGKSGFYRLNRSNGRKTKESIDLKTGVYAESRKPELGSLEAAARGGLRALFDFPDRGGQYAWRVMSRTLSYAAALVPEICGSIAEVDEAMRLGYNWKFGPFELIDRIGAQWFAGRLEAECMTVPDLLGRACGRSFYRVEHGKLQYLDVDGEYAAFRRPEGVLLLRDIKRASKPLISNASAALWDIGDGVTCFEITTKKNTLNDEVLSLLKQAIELTAEGFKAMVIHSESPNFSLGADLRLMRTAIANKEWSVIEDAVARGQRVYAYLKHAPVPVVGAPSGMALGGGCELLLHCNAVQAHAETYMGLVEVGVGVVPAWGGCKELLLRHIQDPGCPGGPMPPITQAFRTIATAKVSKSAADAWSLKFLGANDGITMNLDRLLADAKLCALRLSQGYEAAPLNEKIRLPGQTAKTMLDMVVDGFAALGAATPHGRIVCGRLAETLSGGMTDITEVLSEDDLSILERQAFMSLVQTEATRDCIDHMLETGKPLRN